MVLDIEQRLTAMELLFPSVRIGMTEDLQADLPPSRILALQVLWRTTSPHLLLGLEDLVRLPQQLLSLCLMELRLLPETHCGILVTRQELETALL
jgi:hypothetical protein